MNFEKTFCSTVSQSWSSIRYPFTYIVHKYIGFQEMEMLLDSFLFSNVNYCSLE